MRTQEALDEAAQLKAFFMTFGFAMGTAAIANPYGPTADSFYWAAGLGFIALLLVRALQVCLTYLARELSERARQMAARSSDRIIDTDHV